jgi:Uncharacterized conserved protein (DUF2285)
MTPFKISTGGNAEAIAFPLLFCKPHPPSTLFSTFFHLSGRSNMAQHNPVVADRAPSGDILTPYDNGHLKTYLRLLDADAAGADWKEVARIVLGMDPEREPERARTAWESHLARAKWMTTRGYKHLLRGRSAH